MYELKPMDNGAMLYDGNKPVMELDNTALAVLSQYSDRLNQMGVSDTDQGRIGEMASIDGVLDLGKLVDAYQALAGTKAITEENGWDYDAGEVIDEMVTPTGSRGKKIAIAAGLAVAVALPAAASIIDNPGGTANSDIYAAWDYAENVNGDLTGSGYIDITNIGLETRSGFEFTIQDLLTVDGKSVDAIDKSILSGWEFAYDANTDILTLLGQSDELDSGENFTVPLTFNPDGKEIRKGVSPIN